METRNLSYITREGYTITIYGSSTLDYDLQEAKKAGAVQVRDIETGETWDMDMI
jgi:hypothetical protein